MLQGLVCFFLNFVYCNCYYISTGMVDTGDPGGKPGGYRAKNDTWDTVEKTRQMFSNNR